MPPAANRELVYVGYPWIPRAFGLVLLALCSVVAVSMARSGALNAPLSSTWPFYVIVGGIFTPVALWMVSRPSVRLLVDRDARELAIESVGLSGRTTSQRIPLSDIAGIGPVTVQSTDGDAYYVDLVDRAGKRARVSAGQVRSLAGAERIARQINERIAQI